MLSSFHGSKHCCILLDAVRGTMTIINLCLCDIIIILATSVYSEYTSPFGFATLFSTPLFLLHNLVYSVDVLQLDEGADFPSSKEHLVLFAFFGSCIPKLACPRYNIHPILLATCRYQQSIKRFFSKSLHMIPGTCIPSCGSLYP